MNYCDMTEDQRLAWGAQEADARVADLSGVKSAEALARAQANAEQRRKAIGASRAQAANAVVLAQRKRRLDEWHAERAKAGATP